MNLEISFPKEAFSHRFLSKRLQACPIFENGTAKEVGGVELTLGIVLIAITCLFAVFVVRVAGKSVREFDESKYESFLGK